MAKTKCNLKICVLLLTISVGFSACKNEEDLSVLPQETQSGKNTFGCNVEGKKFFGGYLVHFGIPPLTATYFSKQDLLTINADGKFDDKKQGSMGMQVSNPKVNVTLKMKKVIFDYYPQNFPGTSSIFTEFGISGGGQIFIIKFDTINKIVSGRFSLTGKGAVDIDQFTGNDSIRITDGRFDIKLEMDNN
ncbi:MAG: hypothetical protein RIS29_1819 [Bacteroidota bacterium]|jgi:hypothetical protein